MRYGTIWYDIEKLAWSSDKAKNQEFIKDLVDEGKSLGITAGVYVRTEGCHTDCSLLPLLARVGVRVD